jgi:two-component sensor histidine kinase
MLLNPDGYWLYSENPDDNWGFMYKDGKEKTFNVRYPQAWDRIMESSAGKFIANEGIFIYESIYPMNIDMISSTGSGEANGSSRFSIASEDYFWKLLVFLPEKLFSEMLKTHVLNIAPIYLIFLVIISIFSWLLTKSKIIQIRANEKLKSSLDEKDLLLREIHHRVKNSLALVSGFVGLYRSNYSDQSNDDFFDAIQQKIYTISLVHTYLYQSSDIENISLKSYLNILLDNILQNLSMSTENVELILEMEDIFMTAKETIAIGLILSEFAINSLKHAFPDNRNGKIAVKGNKEGTGYVIIYSDNGIGLPEDFTIKDSDSLGMIIIESLTGQLEGNLSITTGHNSTFTIKFPVID